LHEIDETEKFQPREWVGNNNVRICPACKKVMRRLPIANEETIEVCDECGYSSAEETEEIW
jgi:Zn ribbon nucleic-acid-binding protein